jgi:putative transposase
MCLVGANMLELDDLPVKRPSPRRVTQGLCMDKGYDYPEIWDLVRQNGFTPHIRSRGEECKAMKRRRGYRPRRWVVERTHSWYNRFRALLVRWCKKDENYTAQLHLASAIIIGSFIGLSG